MWILSQSKKALTNGNIIFYVSAENDESKTEYSIKFKNIISEESFKLGTYSSLENCEIVLKIILDGIKKNLLDFILPTNEKVEAVKNDKKA